MYKYIDALKSISLLFIVVFFFACKDSSSTNKTTTKTEAAPISTTKTVVKNGTTQEVVWTFNEFGSPAMKFNSPAKLKKENTGITKPPTPQIEKIDFWATAAPIYQIDNISATFATLKKVEGVTDSTLYATMISASKATIEEFTKTKNMKFDVHESGIKINENPGIMQIMNVADSINFHNAYFLKNGSFYHLGIVSRNNPQTIEACNEIISSIDID